MKKLFLFLIIILISITLTGCTLTDFLAGGSSTAGGVFKSYDYGEKWEPTNIVKSDKKKKDTLGSVSVTKIKLDPQDHKNVYISTTGHGMWYSDDAGSSWQNILPQGYVYYFVLDPKNSGVIYASLGNQIYKTLDLGKNWRSVYLETRGGVALTSLAIDPLNNLLVYVATSNGEVYKTQDGGESWQLVTKAEGVIAKILINPNNSRIIYLATTDQGIYKSSDQGASWTNLKDNFYDTQDRDKRNKYKGVETYSDLIFDLTKNDGLFYASSYGLLKSNDGGTSWQEIGLLTPPNSIIIRSLAINPKDDSQIYYGTDSALYRTFDGGNTWLTSQLSSARSANALLVDFQTPNVLYMGMSRAN